MGTLDLKERGGEIEIEVPHARPVCLEVVVDGERRLPTRYQLYVAGQAVARPDEDPERGEIHLEVPED